MAPAGILLSLSLLALVVLRGIGSDLRAHGRLTEGTANIVAAAFLLDAMIVFLASAGHVLEIAIPQPLALALGVPLLFAGLLLAGAACRELGSRERLLGMRIDAVITTNAYAVSRHPFYVGSSLTLLGAAIAGQSWLALVLAASSAAAMFVVARREERLLTHRMPDAYRSYRIRTPALVGRPTATGAPSPG